jgi:hypothetical protein
LSAFFLQARRQKNCSQGDVNNLRITSPCCNPSGRQIAAFPLGLSSASSLSTHFVFSMKVLATKLQSYPNQKVTDISSFIKTPNLCKIQACTGLHRRREWREVTGHLGLQQDWRRL